MVDREFQPLGFDGTQLRPLKNNTECPKCNEGTLGTGISGAGSDGLPERATTVRCSKCGTSFQLGLREVIL